LQSGKKPIHSRCEARIAVENPVNVNSQEDASRFGINGPWIVNEIDLFNFRPNGVAPNEVFLIADLAWILSFYESCLQFKHSNTHRSRPIQILLDQ